MAWPPTIIHWHGLHLPAAMDGHPASTIGPGGRYEYDFKVSNRTAPTGTTPMRTS